jgi:transposase InsO family protein
MCRVLGVSRAGLYASAKRPPSKHTQEDAKLRVVVKAAFEAGRRYYGSPRVHREVRANGFPLSRKRVARLMADQGLKARVKRRFRCTTDSAHDHPIAPNLLNRDFAPPAPNRSWASDTTELLTNSGKLYLAAVIDLYSRFVVGWALSAVNDRFLTIKALEMALRRRCPGAGLMHHSDRGSTYTSEDYANVLKNNGIICSMSRKGNCYDNAVVESFFKTLKAELGEGFDNHGQAKQQLFDYIEVFYNQKRIHSALDYVSPAEYERSVDVRLVA